MSQFQNSIAIKAWLALMLFWVASLGWAAQAAGTVVQLSGPLLVKRADGAVRVLSVRSEVESGDTLVTERNTYALVRFTDQSEITLKPSTTFIVENFSYDADHPDGDKASFKLVKGGLRSVTGLLGKRNRERFEMKTPDATIGIRGTTFVAQLPPGPPSGGTTPGLYVQVIDGSIRVSNPGGTTQFSAGQFGFTPSPTTPPIVVPQNPGLTFTPPPVFSSPVPPGGSSAVSPKPSAIDCEVR